jgi:MurNAc alpha-1-phosphate uridylyltransferase
MDYTVAILAGGLATRLRPITATIPKAMVEVAGKPFIEHQVELLKKNGLKRFVICSGYLGEQIENFMGDGSRFGVSVEYSHDGEKLLGTAGALRKALDLLDDNFFILYGDSYLDIDYQSIKKSFGNHNSSGLMTVFANSDKYDKSNVVFADGIIYNYDKHKTTADMRHIDYGLGILRKEVISKIPENTVVDLSDIYHQLSIKGDLLGYEVYNRFYEIGSHSGLEEMHNYIVSKTK